MDTINNYHQIITEILGEYAKLPYAHGDLERKFIISEDHKNYLLLTVGYLKEKRVHS
ncbi:MAG: element excision factor XisI family protein, partial [Xenococcus sp. (in: cyanobacteria)]